MHALISTLSMRVNVGICYNITSLKATWLITIDAAIWVMVQLIIIMQWPLAICQLYLLLLQIYRIYSKSYPDKLQLPRQVSAIINSALSSFSSLPGRHTSVASVLSSGERASLRLGRNSSDVSLGFTDRPDSRKNTRSSMISANKTFLVRKEVKFPPIHEETLNSERPQDTHDVTSVCLEPAMMIMVLSEEPKVVPTSSHFKCTEV